MAGGHACPLGADGGSLGGSPGTPARGTSSGSLRTRPGVGKVQQSSDSRNSGHSQALLPGVSIRAPLRTPPSEPSSGGSLRAPLGPLPPGREGNRVSSRAPSRLFFRLLLAAALSAPASSYWVASLTLAQCGGGGLYWAFWTPVGTVTSLSPVSEALACGDDTCRNPSAEVGAPNINARIPTLHHHRPRRCSPSRGSPEEGFEEDHRRPG